MRPRRNTGSVCSAKLTRGARRLIGVRLLAAFTDKEGETHSDASTLLSALHANGLSFAVRWTAYPASVVGAPGFFDLTLLISGPEASVKGVSSELVSLLHMAFSGYSFEPLERREEILYARQPFGRPSWRFVLSPRSQVSPKTVGFALSDEDPRPATPPNALLPAMPERGRVIELLKNGPSVSSLTWHFVPCRQLDQKQRRLLSELAPPEAGEGPSGAFLCTLSWSGVSKTRPVLLREALSGLLSPGGDKLADDSAQRYAYLCPTHMDLPILPPASALKTLAPSLICDLPERLPAQELAQKGLLLGHCADDRTVHIEAEDRLRHTWMVGQTGTGKSTLLLNMVMQDIGAGHGVTVIDPHGDLASSIARLLPASRRRDLVILDLSSSQPDRLPSINVLECSSVREAYIVAGQFVEFIRNIWARDVTGPIFQASAMNALVLLACRWESPGTLVDFPRLFTDEKFLRHWLKDERLKKRVPEVIQWWEGVFLAQSERQRTEYIDYVISKFSTFFTDPAMRTVFGQQHASLNMLDIMDRGKILLCSLNRGVTSPLATSVLAWVLMNRIVNTALLRKPDRGRPLKPHFVYCDEFQRVVGESTATALSEVRKYGVGMVMAHQFIDQIPQKILQSVLGNVATKILFRVGAPDARTATEFFPELQSNELVRLPNFSAIMSVLIQGVPSEPFTLFTEPPPGPRSP